MISAKGLRFMLAYARSDPSRIPNMLWRRVVEQCHTSPAGVAQTHFGNIRYEVDMSAHRQMRKYFYHTHEMFLERIFDKFLASDTLFIDVGANCGYWSAYALSRIGVTGEVHAFEPVPQYFRFIQRLAELNVDFKIFPNNAACGATSERARMEVILPRADNFYNSDINIGSSSLLPGFLDHAKKLTETVEVDVLALDDYMRQHSIDADRIGLIKIDVEGFQEQVLYGMQRLLSRSGRKVPILCEILTDLDRDEPLDGRRTITRLEQFGYRCLNATDLRPLGGTLNFEENIICF